MSKIEKKKLLKLLKAVLARTVCCHECDFKIPLEQDLHQRQDIGVYLTLFRGSIKCKSVNLHIRERTVLPKGQYYPVGKEREAAKKLLSL